MEAKKNFFVNRLKKKFLLGYSKRSGRNFFGRKTVLTQSGGLKSKLFLIDFFRLNTFNGILLTIEKDLMRTGFIGLVCYANGLFSYILLSSKQLEIGSDIDGFNRENFKKIKGKSRSKNKIKINVPAFLKKIPTGNFVYHVESMPGNGAKISRSAGVGSFVIKKEGNYSFLKMNSRWLLKISNFCVAITGVVSNEQHFKTNIKKSWK